MSKVKFAELPVLTKVSTLGTFFIGWILFAEFVIDRHGWDRFLPYYRVGNLCPYELVVAAFLVGIWFTLERR